MNKAKKVRRSVKASTDYLLCYFTKVKIKKITESDAPRGSLRR